MCDLSQASCETGNVNYQRTLSGLERVFDSFVFHQLRMHCVKVVVRKQIPMGFQKQNWEDWNRVARWESARGDGEAGEVPIYILHYCCEGFRPCPARKLAFCMFSTSWSKSKSPWP